MAELTLTRGGKRLVVLGPQANGKGVLLSRVNQEGPATVHIIRNGAALCKPKAAERAVYVNATRRASCVECKRKAAVDPTSKMGGKREGAGRKAGDGQDFSKRINIRVTPRMRDDIDDMAQEGGFAEWVRGAISQRLERDSR